MHGVLPCCQLDRLAIQACSPPPVLSTRPYPKSAAQGAHRARPNPRSHCSSPAPGSTATTAGPAGLSVARPRAARRGRYTLTPATAPALTGTCPGTGNAVARPGPCKPSRACQGSSEAPPRQGSSGARQRKRGPDDLSGVAEGGVAPPVTERADDVEPAAGLG